MVPGSHLPEDRDMRHHSTGLISCRTCDFHVPRSHRSSLLLIGFVCGSGDTEKRFCSQLCSPRTHRKGLSCQRRGVSTLISCPRQRHKRILSSLSIHLQWLLLNKKWRSIWAPCKLALWHFQITRFPRNTSQCDQVHYSPFQKSSPRK